MPDSFSQRYGLAGPPLGTLVRDDAPISLRMFVSDLPHAGVDVGIDDLHKVVCEVLQVWPDPKVYPFYDSERHIKQCEWFRIYDIIGGLFQRLYGKKYYSPFPSSFVKVINKAFFDQNIGWKLAIDGKVVTRGDEVFEGTLEGAVSVLATDKKPTAAGHLRSAIAALSVRPKPNTSGAVAHATSAVECVLGEITGKPGGTLGEYLKKHDLFHPALKKGLEGVYGYASDEGARHGKEGTEPAIEDAEFVIATCAATCTLLIKRRPQ